MLNTLLRFPAFILVALNLVCAYSFAADENTVEASRCTQHAAVLEVAEGVVEAQLISTTQWQNVVEGFRFCYGDALRVVESRASLRLENDTLVRLKEDSVVKFIAPKESFWVELAKGVAHFISRTPKAFEVTSPYLNAAVDGTEFIVAVSGDSSQIYVVEGQVTANNPHGALPLFNNQAAVAYAGQQPKLDINIKLVDSVGWAFQYPLLSNLFDGVSENLQQLIQAGNYTAALQAIEQQPKSVTELQRLNLITALNLSVGKVDAALKVNAKALSLAPNSAEANAAYTLMLLTRGQKDVAVKRSAEALALHPNNTSVLLTDSFVLQAQFNLNDALQSAMAAAELLPTSAGLWLRVAELQLNLNDVKSANDALQKAKAINTSSERLATLQGVIDLKALRFKAAKKQFEQAIAIDNRQPLAHFLLGLTQIRLGKQDVGRQQVELAVLLDPNNSLYRSYLGKIYYDEFRFDKAVDQFNLAKQLDPQDPTPYFYQAIQYQALGRPTDAIVEIQESIVRNDNRAVYRSRMQLDSDYGARSASLADVYLDLGLSEQAINEAEKAKRISPNEFSPYKIMADVRSRELRSGMAAASEYLQAQIRQPLTSIPIRPLLTEGDLVVMPGTGPSSLGQNEYNTLLNKDENNILFSVAYGSENTSAYDAMISGLSGRQSYLLEYYSNQSEGLLGTDKLKYSIASAYYQFMSNEKYNLFFDLSVRDDERGNASVFVADNPDSEIDDKKITNSMLAGFSFSPRSNYLINMSINAVDQDYDISYLSTWVSSPFYTLQYLTDSTSKLQGGGVNLDFIWSFDGGELHGGLKVSESNTNFLSESFYVESGVLDPDELLDWKVKTTYSNKYIYLTNKWSRYFSSVFGMSSIRYADDDLFENTKRKSALKSGLYFRPFSELGINLVYYEFLSPLYIDDKTLEPTHIFSINQFVDRSSASDGEAVAFNVNVDYKDYYIDFLSNDVNSLIPISIGEDFEVSERSSVLKVNKVSGAYSVDFSVDVSSVDLYGSNYVNRPDELDTKLLPIEFKYLSPRNYSISLRWSRVYQRAVYTDRVEGVMFDETRESFSVVDLFARYRTTDVSGQSLVFSIDARNILNENFVFQNKDFLGNSPSLTGYYQGRTIVGKVTWSL